MKNKVLVGMSGGVDSTLSLCLLKEQGYEIAGVNCLFCPGKSTLLDVSDAENVANKLGVPFQVFDFREEFTENVIGNFISTYENGGTPNPCIVCNKYLKFGDMLEKALEQGFDYIATGHYARIEFDEKYGRRVLKKAVDTSKDQSYVLFRLTKEQISSTVFPLGGMSKDEIRALAKDKSLPVDTKKDSQDICFIPDGDYVKFIKEYTKKEYPLGNFVTKDGKILGTHKGIIGYTIGQRKGLGLALPHPMYVCEKRLDTNEVVIGDHIDLFSSELYADNINLSAIDSIDAPIPVKARVRYNQKEQNAVASIENGLLHVVFDEPQRAICKGQSVVLYDGETVLGGGRII